jgi:DNA-binding response OmpR family regulator
LEIVPKQSHPPKANRRRILVVEDDEAIARMLLKVLGTRYAVDYASEGTQAIAIASKVPPHLILLDVMMPRLDGFATAKQLRALPSLRAVPIIFLTAKSAPADVVKGIQAGARHYLTKPFKVDELLAKVKKTLGE